MESEELQTKQQTETVSNVDKWYTPLTRATFVAKVLAMALFVALPFVGFWLGVEFGGGMVSVDTDVTTTNTARENDSQSCGNFRNYVSETLQLSFRYPECWGKVKEQSREERQVENEPGPDMITFENSPVSIVVRSKQDAKDQEMWQADLEYLQQSIPGTDCTLRVLGTVGDDGNPYPIFNGESCVVGAVGGLPALHLWNVEEAYGGKVFCELRRESVFYQHSTSRIEVVLLLASDICTSEEDLRPYKEGRMDESTTQLIRQYDQFISSVVAPGDAHETSLPTTQDVGVISATSDGTTQEGCTDFSDAENDVFGKVCNLRIASHLPAYQFRLVRVSPSSVKYIEVTTPTATDTPLQVLTSREGSFMSGGNNGVFTQDVNFDGYQDLLLFSDQGSGGVSYHVWVYVPSENRFAYSDEVSGIGNMMVDTDKQRIRGSWSSGLCHHTDEEYEYINGKLTLVWEQKEECTGNSSGATMSCVARELKNGVMATTTCVYSDG
ncbi:MAG: hypothetical protein KBD24_03815 [Candidatus Pacebacteria bacterium]|nr:hypothetical protein [Candidatus Paceibacterota bacterium]